MITIWLLIGFIVHKYYLLKDSAKLQQDFMSGKFSHKQYIIGFILTLFLWPVAIYNNEMRHKD